MRLRSSVPALVVLLAATACSKNAATADTDMVACLEPRCDNPDPNSCACPDDTDGVASNTPTETMPDIETSASHGEPTTETPSDTSTKLTETTSTETTSSETTGTIETSTDTSSGTDTTTGSESSDSGSTSSGTN